MIASKATLKDLDVKRGTGAQHAEEEDERHVLFECSRFGGDMRLTNLQRNWPANF